MVKSLINLCWFRQDLRVSDNPALSALAQDSTIPILPIYIVDNVNVPQQFGLGGASKLWLHYSLQQLNASLDGKLSLYIGDPQQIIAELAKHYTINKVYWNRCYEPWRIKYDAGLKQSLKHQGIESNSFNGSLLWEPWQILKADGSPYRVFSYFYYTGCLKEVSPRLPLAKPSQLNLIKDHIQSTTLADLESLPHHDWSSKVMTNWQVGETIAQDKLSNFLHNNLLGYKEYRNYPAKPNVSRLSPHLHFGEISPHQVWHSAKTGAGTNPSLAKDLEFFFSELGWREFSYYLLYHFPELPTTSHNTNFEHFPWREDHDLLTAWQLGKTGYPIVDAGMRELWQTGYMHNRVRMIVGSFLVKNLLQHWQHGADWFWDCLFDADLANNSASWQWVAGTGFDAAPYFRIFNPILQGEKFDPEGTYTRKFVPELRQLPDKYLFKPWQAPLAVLQASGVVLGDNYPWPIVDLDQSRQLALEAYRAR